MDDKAKSPKVESNPVVAAAQNHRGLPPNPGNDSSLWNDALMQQQGIAQLQEAMVFLPEAHRLAYFNAAARCPELVQTESNPIRFLRFEGYNAWAAARRLTTYWYWRIKIFGEDRAFRPMTMTGDGALSPLDIAHLRSAYFFFLPKDTQGRSVLAYDPSRRVSHSKEARMKVGFYMWSILCENDMSQKDGYVGVVLLGTAKFGASSLDGAIKECADVVQECFPTRVSMMHVVQCLPEDGRRTMLQRLIPIVVHLMGQLMENRAVFHSGESKAEVMNGLAKYGLVQSGLPVATGGTWNIDNHYIWQHQRCSLERRMHRVVGRYSQPDSSESKPRALSVSSAASPNARSSMFHLFVPFDTSSETAIHGLAQLDFLIRRLSEAERSAYIDAVQNAPHLVQNESCAAAFLSRDPQDVRVAAGRLALYWKLRRRLFGDRAHLPLTQTGEGSLNRADLSVLTTGFLSVLPNAGRNPMILCYDASKLVKTDVECRLRVAFYMLSLTAERPSLQKEGFIIVIHGIQHLERFSQEELEGILDVLPCNLTAIHILYEFDHGASVREDFSVDDAFRRARHKFGTYGNQVGILHVAANKDEIFEQLEPYGVVRENLPKTLGGDFGYDRFVQWQELRTRLEWSLPPGANDKDAPEIYDFSKVKPLAELSAEEKKERKRRMNVVHSRRKRERERIEIEVLHEQCSELQYNRKRLLAEQHRLQGILKKVEGMIRIP